MGGCKLNRGDFLRSAALAAVTPHTVFDAPDAMPAFRYQNLFWFNLHHTLYYQAYAIAKFKKGNSRLSDLDRAAYAESEAMLGDARWQDGIATYGERYIKADFVFNQELMDADNALGDAASVPSAKAVPRPMRDALEKCAAVYNRKLWPLHHARNAAMLDGLRTDTGIYHSLFARELPRIYRTPWLSQPYVVNAVAYADWSGSYSNMADGFVHIPMSSYEQDCCGLSGVDVLFHEASHSIVDPEYGTIGSSITRAAKQLAKPAPDNFWHALIMYTPGKLAERWFSTRQTPYTMVWIREGLFTQVWPTYYAALEQHWLPYMDGRGTMDDAITACLQQIYANPAT